MTLGKANSIPTNLVKDKEKSHSLSSTLGANSTFNSTLDSSLSSTLDSQCLEPKKSLKSDNSLHRTAGKNRAFHNISSKEEEIDLFLKALL